MDNTRKYPTHHIKTVVECEELISEFSLRLLKQRREKTILEIKCNKMLSEYKEVTEGIAFLTSEIQLLEEKINASQESSANVVKLRKQLAQMKGDIASFRIKETKLDPPTLLLKQHELNFLEAEVAEMESLLELLTLRKQELEAQG